MSISKEKSSLSVSRAALLHSSRNVYFLGGGNPCPKKEYGPTSIQIENDLTNLTATELRKKYSTEYSSWKNMKQRRNTGAVIDPRFERFSEFLQLMGARPSKAYTLDRVDNDNREYSPENCRWADKYTQNTNKGNNVFLEYEGNRLTISQWAKKTGQKPATLYKRRANGWTDEEIVTARRAPSFMYKDRPWPNDNCLNWEKEYIGWLTKKGVQESKYTPIEFYIDVCNIYLARLEPRLERASYDPRFDLETASSSEIRDLDQSKLWDKRMALAKKHFEYAENKKRWMAINKHSFSNEAFNAIYPEPDLRELKNLIGR